MLVFERKKQKKTFTIVSPFAFPEIPFFLAVFKDIFLTIVVAVNGSVSIAVADDVIVCVVS